MNGNTTFYSFFFFISGGCVICVECWNVEMREKKHNVLYFGSHFSVHSSLSYDSWSEFFCVVFLLIWTCVKREQSQAKQSKCEKIEMRILLSLWKINEFIVIVTCTPNLTGFTASCFSYAYNKYCALKGTMWKSTFSFNTWICIILLKRR